MKLKCCINNLIYISTNNICACFPLRPFFNFSLFSAESCSHHRVFRLGRLSPGSGIPAAQQGLCSAWWGGSAEQPHHLVSVLLSRFCISVYTPLSYNWQFCHHFFTIFGCIVIAEYILYKGRILAHHSCRFPLLRFFLFFFFLRFE